MDMDINNLIIVPLLGSVVFPPYELILTIHRIS